MEDECSYKKFGVEILRGNICGDSLSMRRAFCYHVFKFRNERSLCFCGFLSDLRSICVKVDVVRFDERRFKRGKVAFFFYHFGICCKIFHCSV